MYINHVQLRKVTVTNLWFYIWLILRNWQALHTGLSIKEWTYWITAAFFSLESKGWEERILNVEETLRISVQLSYFINKELEAHMN